MTTIKQILLLSKKLFKILPKKFSKFFYIVVLCSFLAALFEMVSISLFLPLLSLLSDASYLDEFDFVISNRYFFLIILAILISVYLFKFLFLIFQSWLKLNFLFSIKYYLNKKIFENYIYLKLEEYNDVDSSKIIRNLTTEINHTLTHFINPLIIFISEFLIVFNICLFLIYVDYLSFIIIFFIFCFSWFSITSITSQKIRSFGINRQKFEANKIQTIIYMFKIFKLIKINYKEKYFINSYDNYTNSHNFNEKKYSFYNEMPRLFIELIGIICFILVIYYLYTNNNIQNIIPIIGVYAASAFKLLPSLNKLILTTQSFKYGLPATKETLNHFKLKSTDSKTLISANDFTKIVLKNINYSYPNTETKLLNKINLTINRGEFIGIMGKSGSGKSTLVNLLIGFFRPKSGQIFIDKKEIRLKDSFLIKSIGYVPQETYILNESLFDNISIFDHRNSSNLKKFKNIIELTELSDFANNLKDPYFTKLGDNGSKISSGQRQRIGIARALFKDPKLLILDESTSNLDSVNEMKIISTLLNLKKKCTIIFVSHKMTSLKDCDSIYYLKNGNLRSSH